MKGGQAKDRITSLGNISAIFVMDKPEGMSSAQVVSKLKRSLGVKKAGHTGTLDPFATGVMVCCVNRATKLARFFLGGGKKYQATLRLGIETDTQDATGKITVEKKVPDFKVETITEGAQRFVGTIEQLPPVYSALKHKGVPLYKLARKGQPVQKPPRTVNISEIRILEIKMPEVRLLVSCSAGTYIRTLCHDIGRVLGCGAHLKQLRRVESCGFDLSNAIRPEQLDNLIMTGEIYQRIVPMADALPDLSTVTVDEGLKEKINHGRSISKSDLNIETDDLPDQYIKIVDREHRLLSILKTQGDGNTLRYCCVLQE